MRFAMDFVRLGVSTAGVALLLSTGRVLADDPPPPPPPAPAEDEPPFFDQDRVDVETPRLRVERPTERWLFVNLEVLAERARAAGQDMEAFAALKARLYMGRIRANILVHAYPDPVSRREPISATVRGREALEVIKARLVEARVEQQGVVTIAGKEGYSFELRAKKAQGSTEEIVLLRTVVYRQADNHVFVITLECPAEHAVDLKKDYVKLLKKLRL